MKPNEIHDFSGVIAALAVMYRSPAMSSPDMIEMYWQVLEKYSLSDIKRGIKLHMENPDHGKFFPKPADIICHLETGSETKSSEAWGKLLRAVRSCGRYDKVVFDDEIIHYVMNLMGGWISFCDMTNRDVPFRASEFKKLYAQELKKPIAERKYPGLRFVTHDTFRGDPVKFIGDQKRAEEIYTRKPGELLNFQDSNPRKPDQFKLVHGGKPRSIGEMLKKFTNPQSEPNLKRI